MNIIPLNIPIQIPAWYGNPLTYHLYDNNLLDGVLLYTIDGTYNNVYRYMHKNLPTEPVTGYPNSDNKYVLWYIIYNVNTKEYYILTNSALHSIIIT